MDYDWTVESHVGFGDVMLNRLYSYFTPENKPVGIENRSLIEKKSCGGPCPQNKFKVKWCHQCYMIRHAVA